MLFALCGSAMADELANAEKLLEAKSYQQAVSLLNRLADAGNAGAQLRLGQVYWYGEGVAVDRSKADTLFAKAAAAGSKDAAQALGLTAARQQHLADIDHWTAKYDGADLSGGQFDCKAPAVPAKSTTNADIKATNDAVNAWKACYNGFVENLGEAMPAGKRIPAEIADLMSDQEIELAKSHLDQVYTRVLGQAKANADKTLAAYDQWQQATANYARQQNIETAQRIKELELANQNMSRNMPPPPAMLPPPTRK
jgi:hypothetical protein